MNSYQYSCASISLTFTETNFQLKENWLLVLTVKLRTPVSAVSQLLRVYSMIINIFTQGIL